MADKHNHLLELVMFDIAYVISNCDYEYSSDEKKYLNVILDRYSDDDKELLKLRTQFLDSILEKGIEEVKSFVVNLSKSLKSKIDDDMKEAFIELQVSEGSKAAFKSLSFMEFWIYQLPLHPLLARVALEFLTPFPTTYLCELGFSAMLQIKTKARNRLSLEPDLRLALTKKIPRVERLVSAKEKEHKAHKVHLK